MRLKKIYDSIAFRISFSIATVIAATTFAIGYLILGEEKRTLELELHKKGGILAHLISHHITEPILYEEKHEIFSMLKSSMMDDESLVVYAEVYNNERELIVSAYKDAASRNITLQPVNFEELINEIIVREDSSLDIYHISLPIISENPGPIGYLRLGITKKFLFATLARIKEKLLLFSGSVIFLGIMLGLWMARKILRPILILNKGVKRVGEGEVGVEIPLIGEGEIKELAKSFNMMSKKLKDLIHEIKAAQDNLIRTEKLYAVGEFSAGVAHEIKNPLTSIKMLMQTLEQKKQPMSSRDFTIIEGEINRIDTIVKEFLAFARPKKIEKTEVNINELLEEVITLTRPKMKQSRIELEKDFSSQIPVIKGNIDGLKQVFLNVVLNAIQAIEEGGTVRIKTGVNEKEAVILIKDDGMGIPEKNLKSIFDPFFTTKKEGTGMGLALAYNIISDHSGKLDIESKQGIGTTVKVALPL